ncbi:MAG: protein BatD, partial [Luteibacter sp.]
LRAVASGDLALTEHRLLGWARILRPGVRSLGDLAAALRPGDQRDLLVALQRARFGHGGIDMAGLGAAFDKGFDWAAPERPVDSGGLPPLYPR